MDYIKVRNWDKWQTYRNDRGQPPWIKVHRTVMRNPDWVSLTDAERGQLVAMWLLAADRDGVIPASPEIIQKLCFMQGPPNISKFRELGFLASNGSHPDANVTPSGRQYDAPETETETDKRREEKKEISPRLQLGEFGNVSLSEQEHQKLISAFGEGETLTMIESLSQYIASKGKKYRSHYATLLSWSRKNGQPRVDKRNRNAFLDAAEQFAPPRRI